MQSAQSPGGNSNAAMLPGQAGGVSSKMLYAVVHFLIFSHCTFNLTHFYPFCTNNYIKITIFDHCKLFKNFKKQKMSIIANYLKISKKKIKKKLGVAVANVMMLGGTLCYVLAKVSEIFENVLKMHVF